MILKFEEIRDMAVFKDFKWDSSVLDSNGCPLSFKQVNIVFGRNYSGKTTLSRIIRAFETGSLSDKYGEPSFRMLLSDGTILSEESYMDKPLLTRVFNEDFVRDNLQFVVNPDSDILPFAILGEDNTRIEAEISAIKEILGEQNGDESTGLYAKRNAAKVACALTQEELKKATSILDKQMDSKATGKGTGIKYQLVRFNRQNYNIANLRQDISIVLDDSYVSPSDSQIALLEATLVEQKKEAAKELSVPKLRLEKLISTCKELCERKIGGSEKIQELLRNATLESWVRQGIELHKGKDRCAFCGQPLLDERWDKLGKHFDAEMETLNADIRVFLQDIEEERLTVQKAFNADSSKFYADYVEKLMCLKSDYDTFIELYSSELDKLKSLAQTRQKSIHEDFIFEYKSVALSCYAIFMQYTELREQSNNHGVEISTAKNNAQNALRLYEVRKFVDEIDYSGQVNHISELEHILLEKQEAAKAIAGQIEEQEKLIENKKRLLHDEEKGAVKVNEYLNTYFGHRYLSLQAVTTEEFGNTKIRFEIVRDGKKAYHLSEGECSLIAFCYFVAKLDDVETAGRKPIIWIDDPISSLDNNHIYFLFSLIQNCILDKDSYEQLFVTTHNLVFLKYLHRISINKHGNGTDRIHLIVERMGEKSVIKLMPKYLREHGTEFQHWFGLIYKCSQQTGCADENAYLFESFGNTVRKFFEVYLYYRYPDEEKVHVHLQKFFGKDKIPALILDKMGDEQSHSQGDLENHALPFEVPETIEVAKLILKKLEEKDKEQYDLLVASTTD